jgi:hypothetical protein
MKKRIIILFAAVTVFAGLLILIQPDWLRRIGQRREVYARVQAAGGWEALRSDCLLLLQANQVTNHYFWHRGQTNQPALPPAIAALQPMSIYAYSPGVVSISIFGMGETGHRGIPNYGLEVDCGPPINPDEPRLYPNRTYHKINGGIYENY